MYSNYDDHELMFLRYRPCHYNAQHRLDEKRLAAMELDRNDPEISMLIYIWECSPSLPGKKRAYIEQYMLDYMAYRSRCDARKAWEEHVVAEFKEADPVAYRKIEADARLRILVYRRPLEEEIRERVVEEVAGRQTYLRQRQAVKPKQDDKEVEFFRCVLEAARSLWDGTEPVVTYQAEASTLEDYYKSRDPEFFSYVNLMLETHKTFIERVPYGTFYNTLMHEMCMAMSQEGTGHVAWRVPRSDREKLALLIDFLDNHLLPRLESPEQFEYKEDEGVPPKQPSCFPRRFAPPDPPSPYDDSYTTCTIL